MSKYQQTSKSKDIQKALLEQLKTLGKDTKQNKDLVKDYARFIDIKDKALRDINKRGINVEYNNGGGQKGFKKNDSCEVVLKYSQQMIKILQHLNLDYTAPKEEDEDEL